MYIDMGERIAGKQDRPSMIIEDHLRSPKIAQNIYIVSTVMRSAFADILVPLVPLDPT